MSRSSAFPVAAVLLALAAGPAASWSGPGPATGYTVLKAGGYDLDRAAPGHDTLEGLFLGLELGSSWSRHVELAMTADWLRRRSGRTEVLYLDTPYDLPVEGVIELEGASTDLVPLGGLLRVRFPVAGGRFVPFVAGQLTYDILRLAYHEGGNEVSELFHGWGSTVTLGLEARLDERFGVLFEAGAHESEPEQDLTVGDTAITGRVKAGGEFVRVGMRFGFG